MLELLELHVLNVGQGLDSSIMQVNSSEVCSEGGGEREGGGGRGSLCTPLHRTCTDDEYVSDGDGERGRSQQIRGLDDEPRDWTHKFRTLLRL